MCTSTIGMSLSVYAIPMTWSPSYSVGIKATGGAHLVELDTGIELAAILEQYGEEIRRCRYGTFRGVIKNGRVVIFAVEHEWRPQLETRRQPPGDEQAAS